MNVRYCCLCVRRPVRVRPLPVPLNSKEQHYNQNMYIQLIIVNVIINA